MEKGITLLCFCFLFFFSGGRVVFGVEGAEVFTNRDLEKYRDGVAGSFVESGVSRGSREYVVSDALRECGEKVRKAFNEVWVPFGGGERNEMVVKLGPDQGYRYSEREHLPLNSKIIVLGVEKSSGVADFDKAVLKSIMKLKVECDRGLLNGMWNGGIFLRVRE